MPYPISLSYTEIIFDYAAEQLIALNLADQTAGIFIVCDIGRILGEKIAHHLIYRIVALLHERRVYSVYYTAYLCIAIVGNGEGLKSAAPLRFCLSFMAVSPPYRLCDGAVTIHDPYSIIITPSARYIKSFLELDV